MRTSREEREAARSLMVYTVTTLRRQAVMLRTANEDSADGRLRDAAWSLLYALRAVESCEAVYDVPSRWIYRASSYHYDEGGYIDDARERATARGAKLDELADMLEQYCELDGDGTRQLAGTPMARLFGIETVSG